MFFKLITFFVSFAVCCVISFSFFVVGKDSIFGGSNYVYSKKIENDISLMERAVERMRLSNAAISVENIIKGGYLGDYPTILGKDSYKISSDGALISATINRKEKVINDNVCYLINNKDNVKIIRFEMNMSGVEKKSVFMESMRDIYPKRRSCSIVTYFTRDVDGKTLVNTDYLIASFSSSEKMKRYLK